MIKKILFILGGILISLAATETYFRLLYPQLVYRRLTNVGANCYRANPVYFAQLQPHALCRFLTPEYTSSVKTNNLGFVGDRDTEITKAPGTKRIVFIGDSFTFGQGVPASENYPSVVGDLLNRAAPPTVEVINASMPGSSVSWYYLLLKEKILPLKPDLVVVGLFMGNDITEIDYFRYGRTDTNGLPVSLESLYEYVDGDGTRRLKNFPLRYKVGVLRNLHTFIFLAQTFFGAPKFTVDLAINGSACLLKPACHELDRNHKEVKKLLLAMDDMAKKNNTRLLVVLIPWEVQLPRILTKRSGLEIVVSNNETRHYINEMYGDFFTKNDIWYLDLLAAFENYTGDDMVFYPHDKHWTAAGHRIAGEAVYQKIMEFFFHD